MDIRADEHTIHLKLKSGKAMKLEYNEATINESLDFLETINKKDFSLIEFVYNFMVQFADKKITKPEFKKNVIMEFSEVLDIIKKTRFSGLFEGNNEEQTEIDEISDEKLDEDKQLAKTKKQLARSVSYASMKMGIDPKRIMNEYSWTELIFWTEWYIYHENEKTEEGRKLNATYDTKEHIDENREFYDKEFSKIDLYLKQQREGKKN